MFEYRVGGSYAEVSALFGEGIRLTTKTYVEDPETGTLLTQAAGLGREESGKAFVLRWHGRPVAVEARATQSVDEHGTHPLLSLSQLGTSSYARLGAGVPHTELTPEDAARALRVAAEACVVYAAYRETYGPGVRVADTLDPERELAPADFGYGEITPVPWDAR